MPIYICDTVLNQMISSLSESVKKVYSTSDGVTQYPILIGAGNSGNTIASRISAMIGQTEGAGAVTFYPIEVGQKGGELRGIDPQKIAGQSVLICDSIVNTGKTLLHLKEQFKNYGAKDVKTLTLFLRRGAALLPNFWITDIGKEDVVFFGTDCYPINLYDKGNIQKLDVSHCGSEVDCGKAFINPVVDDYYFRQCVDPTYCGYVIEDKNKIVGILFFKHTGPNQIYLEVLCVGCQFQGLGYGSNLVKFFDEYCAMNGITDVKLYAHESAVEFWVGTDFVRTKREFDSPKYGKFIGMERKFQPFRA